MKRNSKLWPVIAVLASLLSARLAFGQGQKFTTQPDTNLWYSKNVSAQTISFMPSNAVMFYGGSGKYLKLTFTKDSVITSGGLLPDEAAVVFIKWVGLKYIWVLDSLRQEIHKRDLLLRKKIGK